MNPDCTARHCEKAEGLWRQGDDDSYGRITQANGSIAIRAMCRRCRVRSSAIPIAVWEQWQRRGATFEWTDSNRLTQPCVVVGCLETLTEYHHFAPRNTFDDPDRWPCLPLCRRHHTEWHTRMDGYQSRSRAA